MARRCNDSYDTRQYDCGRALAASVVQELRSTHVKLALLVLRHSVARYGVGGGEEHMCYGLVSNVPHQLSRCIHSFQPHLRLTVLHQDGVKSAYSLGELIGPTDGDTVLCKNSEDRPQGRFLGFRVCEQS